MAINSSWLAQISLAQRLEMGKQLALGNGDAKAQKITRYILLFNPYIPKRKNVNSPFFEG